MSLSGYHPIKLGWVICIDIEGAKIDCSSLFIVPATSAAQNRLLFFFFLLWPFTVLMKKTRAVKQSIIFRCLWLYVGKTREVSLKGKALYTVDLLVLTSLDQLLLVWKILFSFLQK